MTTQCMNWSLTRTYIMVSSVAFALMVLADNWPCPCHSEFTSCQAKSLGYQVNETGFDLFTLEKDQWHDVCFATKPD